MCAFYAHKQKYFLAGIFPQELLRSDEDRLLKRVVLFFPKTEEILILVHVHDCGHKHTLYINLVDILNYFVVKMSC